MKRYLSALLLAIPSLIVLPLLASAPAAFAKGTPDRITIAGPDLARPIEIVDRKTLERMNPWGGRFIDRGEPAPSGPAPGGQRYDVAISIKDRQGKMEAIYLMTYSPGPPGERGYLYLPGEGEKGYLVNIRTIWRPGYGQWHRATSEWDALVAPQVERPRG